MTAAGFFIRASMVPLRRIFGVCGDTRSFSSFAAMAERVAGM
ncbi:hypothetical protein [Streptomyces sp. NPDC005181]